MVRDQDPDAYVEFRKLKAAEKAKEDALVNQRKESISQNKAADSEQLWRPPLKKHQIIQDFADSIIGTEETEIDPIVLSSVLDKYGKEADNEILNKFSAKAAER